MPSDRQGLMRGRRLPGVLVVAAALALADAALATHAPDHRFLLIGFVVDDLGRPLADVPVVITRVKTALQYPTRTERDGIYFVVVHLHDEDEGETLRLQASGATGEIRARFDARDHKVERGTRVDFHGGRMVENRQTFAETLRAYLAR